MNVQELLDALKKALNEINLDQVAVWALFIYLQESWKNEQARPVRPFDLAKNLSNFYVDLSQHRLSEKIVRQTPETESHLMKFFGASENNLSRFWTQCIEIWNIILQSDPKYAREVKAYFDMLLQASLQKKPTSTPASSTPYHLQAANPISTREVQSENLEASELKKSKASKEDDTPPSASKVGIPESTPEVDLASDKADENSKPEADPASGETEFALDVPALPFSAQAQETKVFPKNAFLVLQGTRVIPLNQPFIKVGRQLDNHIVLEDPRVSRYHAQLKLIHDRFVIFDVNSTGGTFVNGQKVGQSVLYAGDVISLAGVIFIYSQEMPARPGELKIIELGSSVAADRKTAVMRRDEIKPMAKTEDLPELPKTGPLPKSGSVK